MEPALPGAAILTIKQNLINNCKKVNHPKANTMKTNISILTLTLGAFMFLTGNLYAQDNSESRAAESHRMDSVAARHESDLIQKAEDETRLTEAKRDKRQSKAKAKDAQRAGREASVAARESRNSYKAEKSAQKARRKADKQAIRASKAKRKSDAN